MNNYSWLQQRLHQLALSSQFMRETTFDVESSMLSPTNATDNHVFIAGLARSGSTILLNAIYQSDAFASLTYADMPFVLSPNFWAKISSNKKHTEAVERAHGDGIKVSTKSPEAFEEVFWRTFDDNDSESIEKFKTYVQLITHKYQKNRYLSKNNQNIRRLELITELFPDAKILIPFREPTQHAYSLLTQHKKFIKNSENDNFISNYMQWIGHTEFGPNYIPIHNKNLNFKDDAGINHWVEQWYLTYKECQESLQANKNVQFVCYEKLCHTKEYWFEILNFLAIDTKYEFAFKESKRHLSIVIDENLNHKTSAIYNQLRCYT